MRSCASKNSWGGAGCISEIALYGNGSFTLSTLRCAPSERANSTAVLMALTVMSEPSVGTRIRLNMDISLQFAAAAPRHPTAHAVARAGKFEVRLDTAQHRRISRRGPPVEPDRQTTRSTTR